MKLHDLSAESERQFLADAMFRPERIADAIGVLTPADFLTGPHRRIWAAIVELHGQGHPPTHAVVGDHLRHTGGDPKWVADLLDCGTGAIRKHQADVLRYSPKEGLGRAGHDGRVQQVGEPRVMAEARAHRELPAG